MFKILAKFDWLILATALAVSLTAYNWQNGSPLNPATRKAVAVDPVVASFERQMNHRPAPPRPARRDDIDDDVLYRTMNRIHWSVDDERLRTRQGGPDEQE